MDRLFVSFFLVWVASFCHAGSFGRFGFTEVPEPPNWKFKTDGLKPLFSRSDTIYFEGTVDAWKPTSIQASFATYALTATGRAPTKARINLFAPGPEFLFEKGFVLKFTTLSAPRLSWSEGSVGENLEAAKSKWIAVSFQDSQPPVLLSFLGDVPTLILTGSAGDWTLSAAGTGYTNWVRFSLPLGVRALTTTGADMLGLLVKNIKDHEEFWSGPSAVPIGLKIVNQKDAVVGTWEFSEKNAVVPFAAYLARRGGYDVQVLSRIQEISAPTNEGPLAYSLGKELKIRFPVLDLGRARSLVSKAETWTPSIPDPAKPFSLFNAGMSVLVSARPKPYPNQLLKLLDGYLEKNPFAREPVSKSKLPFVNEGASVSEAAFYALLQQAVLCSEGVNTRPNGLYASILWARDVQNWQLPLVQDQKLRRRATALAAITGALSQEPRMRLDGAMLEAGLVAERALSKWNGIKNPPKLQEPVEQIRRRLFKPGEIFITKREPILPMLVNPVRVLIGPALSAKNLSDGYIITWNSPDNKPQRVVFQSPQTWEFEPVSNLTSIEVKDATTQGRYEILIKSVKKGPAQFRVRVMNAKPISLPLAPQIIYTEEFK